MVRDGDVRRLVLILAVLCPTDSVHEQITQQTPLTRLERVFFCLVSLKITLSYYSEQTPRLDSGHDQRLYRERRINPVVVEAPVFMCLDYKHSIYALNTRG